MDNANVTLAPEALFAGNGGRWATAQLKAASQQGKPLTSAALRTLDTLRHEEWKYFDSEIMAEAVIRLVGVADLVQAGLVKNVPNALGKMMFAYEKATDMDDAQTSLDGLNTGTPNDKQEFLFNQLPLPVTHKDFFLNLRQIAASREKGESLDTTQARTAGRKVAEQLEYMLFRGGRTFGGAAIYGYTTAPHRVHTDFGTGSHWGLTAKTGQEMLDDTLTMLRGLSGNRMNGPYFMYVPTDAGINLANDFKANSDLTIRQRLEGIDGIKSVRVADQLPSQSVILVQATMDTTSWVQGETIQAVQWDEGGGFRINFKAWAIGVPLIRDTAASRSGLYHMQVGA